MQGQIRALEERVAVLEAARNASPLSQVVRVKSEQEEAYSENFDEYGGSPGCYGDEEEEDKSDAKNRSLSISEQAERLDHIELRHTDDGKVAFEYVWKDGTSQTEQLLRRLRQLRLDPPSPPQTSSLPTASHASLANEVQSLRSENQELRAQLENFQRLYEERYSLPHTDDMYMF